VAAPPPRAARSPEAPSLRPHENRFHAFPYQYTTTSTDVSASVREVRYSGSCASSERPWRGLGLYLANIRVRGRGLFLSLAPGPLPYSPPLWGPWRVERPQVPSLTPQSLQGLRGSLLLSIKKVSAATIR
jgi:hypothetical protein